MAQQNRTMTEAEVQEILDLLGDPEEAAQQLEAFSRSARFLAANYGQFREKYPDKWVAVRGDDILTADALNDLFADLDKAGIPRGDAVVRYIRTDDHILIL